MGKYVDVETVKVIAHDYLCVQQDEDAFMSEIEDASTSDVAPARHAYWRGFTRNGVWDLACSACDAPIPFGVTAEEARYCQRCGARMDGQDTAQ